MTYGLSSLFVDESLTEMNDQILKPLQPGDYAANCRTACSVMWRDHVHHRAAKDWNASGGMSH